MNDATESQLMRAFELVEAGRLDDARAILTPLLTNNRNNPDVWWVYAHAVTDPLVAQDALNNVLRLDEGYPGARELKSQLESQLVTAPEFAPPPPPVSDEPDFAEIRSAADDPDDGGFNLPRILLIAAVFVLIAVISLALANQTSQPVPATPTAVVSVPTFDASALATDNANADSSATEAVAGDALRVVAAALNGFPLREPDAVTLEDAAGETVVFTHVCGPANASLLSETVNRLKTTLGQVSSTLGSDVERIGIRALDCATNTPLVQIAVDVQSAQAFAAGSLSDAEFSRRWTAVS
ncbi:MAG: hypothetical protein SF162_04780 [bacterium]|nr:hypothetical protein [bacterium]